LKDECAEEEQVLEDLDNGNFPPFKVRPQPHRIPSTPPPWMIEVRKLIAPLDFPAHDITCFVQGWVNLNMFNSSKTTRTAGLKTLSQPELFADEAEEVRDVGR